MSRVQILNDLLCSYATTDDQKEQCNWTTTNMVADGLSEKVIELHLASAITDGLRQGNWPWISSYNNPCASACPYCVF